MPRKILIVIHKNALPIRTIRVNSELHGVCQIINVDSAAVETAILYQGELATIKGVQIVLQYARFGTNNN
jgi:hypothetical protein